MNHPRHRRACPGDPDSRGTIVPYASGSPGRGAEPVIVLLKGKSIPGTDLLASIYSKLENRLWNVDLNSSLSVLGVSYKVSGIKELEPGKAEVKVQRVDTKKEFTLQQKK